MVVPVWKPAGWTPLEVVRWYKEEGKVVDTVSYAGRLDPMAEGVLLLLVGQTNKGRKEFENLPKTYETDIVWGITTDTFDPLGIVQSVSLVKKPTRKSVLPLLPPLIGKKIQPYPPYSSKTVGGKPLYWWARNNKLSEIEIPTREIQVFSVDLLTSREMRMDKFVELMLEKIGTVRGDFRQDKIVEKWRQVCMAYGASSIAISRLQISCGSGTYIRGMVSELGEAMGCGAIAGMIVRTQVGIYEKKNCLVAG